VKQDIEKAVQLNPTITPSEISRGFGIGYSPMCASLAAENRSTLTSEVRRTKYKELSTLASDRYLLANFETHTKKKVDEEGSKNSEEERDKEVLLLCSPYCRYNLPH